jgi:hypothetical protein
MMLSAPLLVHYLLERGFVDADAVVDGGLIIEELPRRNNNFKVADRSGRGFFLKQVRRWDAESIRTLQCEAQCYALPAKHADFADLAGVMPKFHSYDQRRAVLVTELLKDAETVAEHHFRNESFPVDVAEQLGSAFGNCHRKIKTKSYGELTAIFPRRSPWVLALHQMTPHMFPELSGANYQLLGIVKQFPEYGRELDRLRAQWRFETLVHGDIKWDNCLLSPNGGGKRSLKIIDWELADWGDPCWDVAAIFNAYLSFWVQSLPAHGGQNAEILVAQTRYPVDNMQPAMRVFWRTYCDCLGVAAKKRRELLDRTVRYCGARMVQSAFESLQFAQQLNQGAILLLQASLNVLTKPAKAARDLLGIESA